MSLPTPFPGLIVRYDFLWHEERRTGAGGGKDRPACIVLVVPEQGLRGRTSVLIVPITHSPPKAGTNAIEIPPEEKRRLKLDDQPSWIITDQVNIDFWPNGLAQIPGRIGDWTYGRLSYSVLQRVAMAVREAQLSGGLLRIVRD